MMIFLVLLLLKLQSSLQLTVLSSTSQDDPPIAKPGCQHQCGEVKIPYPFGIGSKCYHNESYEIICNTSFHPPKPFLPVHDLRFEVMDINWDGRYSDISPESEDGLSRSQILLVKNVFHNICISDNGGITDSPVVQRVDLRGTPFLFSTQLNVFVAKGCGASLVLRNSSSEVVTGCATVCTNNISKKNMTNCIGVGCCQSRLSSSTNDIIFADGEDGLDYYEIDMNHEALSNPQICNMAAGLLDKRRVTEFLGSFSSLTTVLEWSGPFMSDNFDRNTFGFGSLTCSCSSNRLLEGCVGNPYLGCQCKWQRCISLCSRNIYPC